MRGAAFEPTPVPAKSENGLTSPTSLYLRVVRGSDTARLARRASGVSPFRPEAPIMTSIESFLIEIDQIPWFANVGKPSELDGQALRITSWEAWPGPQTPGGELMQEAQVERHERLLAAGDRLQIEALWQSIHDRVFMRAIPRVPWKDNEDAWYGPNAAVWGPPGMLHSSAGSLGIDLDQGSLGGEWTLAAEWRWLRAGHWPCLYFWQWGETSLAMAARSRPHRARQLIVF
jgi:hypothetical protein